MEKQRMLDGSIVPVGSHRDDIVVCSNGETYKRKDVEVDVNGCYHCDDEDRMEANAAIVQEILAGVEKSACEYATENTDYADGYFHIIDETSHDWPARVNDWIESSYGDWYGKTDYDDFKDELIAHIVEGLNSDDCEAEFGCNEYGSYSGKGCCLWGTDIGEIEEQIDISYYPALKDLHDAGELNDCFDRIGNEFCLSRRAPRVKNEKTGYYEYVGRETYDHYGSDHPTVELYTMPGGRWDFVVSQERMDELVVEYLEARAGCDD